MKNSSFGFPTTRREFLSATGKGIGLLAFGRFAPEFLVQSTLAQAPAPETGRTILVVVQLAGGNDGLNTVVPYTDSNYHRLRPTLALRDEELVKIDDHTALHAALGPLHGLFQDGKLAILQAVGYPNPNRSHFRSTEIWDTASDSNQFLDTGWLGRFFDNACGGAPPDGPDPVGLHLTGEVPQSFLAARPHNTFGQVARGNGRGGRRDSAQLLESLVDPTGHPENTNLGFLRHTFLDAIITERKIEQLLDADHAAASYPPTPFAQSLHQVAALIAAGLPTRVYFVSLGGFDTHSNQRNQQANLLRSLAEGLAAFQQDLAKKKLENQVLTMTFSEFGRRPSENQSGGTDHGTAAPLFIVGSRVKAGLHGAAPSLDLPRNQDLAFTTDFRSIYATILDRWLGCRSAEILGQPFPLLEFV